MISYVIQRLLQGVLVLFFVSLLTFTVMYYMPGDPARTMVGQAKVTDEQLDAIREKWHLNDSYPERYWYWVSNFVRGDMGTSMMMPGFSIGNLMLDRAGWTLRLTVLSFSISILLAIPIGMLAAIKRYSLFDYFSTVLSTVGVAMPNYFVGIILIVLLSGKLGWLPPFGADNWKSYIMPVSVLALEEMAGLARLTRGATIEILSQDYIKTAHAKGLAPRTVILRHVVRNALLPIITLLGYRMAFILSGTIVIETVFSWPGIGRLFYQAITFKDLQLVQAIVFMLTALVVLANILTDLTYAFIDPRVRLR
jgi:ABC-type dipeptide/oligopeptide/nickel transport system permease component